MPSYSIQTDCHQFANSEQSVVTTSKKQCKMAFQKHPQVFYPAQKKSIMAIPVRAWCKVIAVAVPSLFRCESARFWTLEPLWVPRSRTQIVFQGVSPYLAIIWTKLCIGIPKSDKKSDKRASTSCLKFSCTCKHRHSHCYQARSVYDLLFNTGDYWGRFQNAPTYEIDNIFISSLQQVASIRTNGCPLKGFHNVVHVITPYDGTFQIALVAIFEHAAIIIYKIQQWHGIHRALQELGNHVPCPLWVLQFGTFILH